MFCLVCTGKLELLNVDESTDKPIVARRCTRCSIIWELTYYDRSIILIKQGGVEIKEKFGFDYTCPKCGFSSHVSTVLTPTWGWKCVNCGEKIPHDSIKLSGGYELPPERERYIRSSTSRTKSTRTREPSLQRTPRSSKPLPEGAVSLKEIAERLNMEPKKLRSWLRKVNWRSSEERGSQWTFTPSEVEELITTFKGK